MQIDKFWVVVLNHFRKENPIVEVSCDVLFLSTQRNRINPFVNLHQCIIFFNIIFMYRVVIFHFYVKKNYMLRFVILNNILQTTKIKIIYKIDNINLDNLSIASQIICLVHYSKYTFKYIVSYLYLLNRFIICCIFRLKNYSHCLSLISISPPQTAQSF